MIAFGTGIAFVYSLVAALVLATADVALPVTPALLGIAGSTAALETLAWSGERRRRRALEALESAKQQFTDMLVHDLKRRMSSILMAVSVLEKKTDDGSVAELTGTIRASAERMLLLTGNLLDIRRIEEGRLALRREPLALRALVQESASEHRLASALSGVGMTVEERQPVTVAADRNVLLRVMANLLWNAFQHAPAGSAVVISYGPAGEGAAGLEVANEGVPVPAGEAANLFNAFVTTQPADSREANTGLGLTFCKLAVEAHGGSIAIESPWKDGRGVRIRVTLPLAA
jgi:signal transduction histidine kinase